MFRRLIWSSGKSILLLIVQVLILSNVQAVDIGEYVEVFGQVTTTSGNNVSHAKIMFISRGDTLSQLTGYGKSRTYKFNLPVPSVSSVEHRHNSLPHTITLLQNYPNPFNPSTVIEYELSSSARINLSIYNILGQTIRNLESASKQPGRYRIIWDGRDKNGQFAGTGMYFYRIESGEKYLTRKMLLLDGGGQLQTSGNSVTTGYNSVQKPAAENFIEYEIVVIKEGYETFYEDNFIVNADAGTIRKDITLRSLLTSGDYFPLSIGNTWIYIDTQSVGFQVTADNLVSEWNTSVTGTLNISGKLYYILDRWTQTLPAIFHEESTRPLVRLDENGDFFLRYHDVDILLYEFSKPDFKIIYDDLHEFFSDFSDDINKYPEQYEHFKNVELAIEIFSEGVFPQVLTPAGTYDDCLRVWIHVSGENREDYLLYFNRVIGPVSFVNWTDNQKPDFFLKSAQTGNIHHGVPPTVATGNSVSDADIAEILRLTLDTGRVSSIISYSNMSRSPVVGTKMVISTENIPDYTFLPSIPNITFNLMDHKATFHPY